MTSVKPHFDIKPTDVYQWVFVMPKEHKCAPHSCFDDQCALKEVNIQLIDDRWMKHHDELEVLARFEELEKRVKHRVVINTENIVSNYLNHIHFEKIKKQNIPQLNLPPKIVEINGGLYEQPDHRSLLIDTEGTIYLTRERPIGTIFDDKITIPLKRLI